MRNRFLLPHLRVHLCMWATEGADGIKEKVTSLKCHAKRAAGM